MKFIKDIKGFLGKKSIFSNNNMYYVHNEVKYKDVIIRISPGFDSSRSFEKKMFDIVDKISLLKKKWNLVLNKVDLMFDMEKTDYRVRLINLDVSTTRRIRVIRFVFSDIDDVTPIPQDIVEEMVEDITSKLRPIK